MPAVVNGIISFSYKTYEAKFVLVTGFTVSKQRVEKQVFNYHSIVLINIFLFINNIFGGKFNYNNNLDLHCYPGNLQHHRIPATLKTFDGPCQPCTVT